MRDPRRILGFVFLSALTCCVRVAPLVAQEPGCNDSPPAAASVPPGLVTSCGAGTDPLMCDLGIGAADALTHRSPDLRIGEPFPGDGSSTVERPRFFFDSAGNRYFTKLFSRFQNLGGIPAAVGTVTVTFSFREAATWDDTSQPWQAIGAYTMNIPAVSGHPGVLFPGEFHDQQLPVCWARAPGAEFPRTFTLRAQLDWPAGPDGNPANNTATSFYDLSSDETLAQIAFAIDLTGSMNALLPDGVSKLTEAKQKAQMFTHLVEPGNQLGVYGFATDNPANSSFAASYIDANGLAHSASMNDTSEIAPLEVVHGATELDSISAAISAQTAHGCTPIGQGLLRAKAGLATLAPPAPNASRAIVLFSDGLQNVPPFVHTAPFYTCGGTAAIPIDAAKTFKDDGIKVYAIYFGPEVGWAYDLMNQLKEETGSHYVYGATTGIGLAAAYYSIRGLVDDTLFFTREGTTSEAGPWPTFKVGFDAAAKLATVAVAWPYGDGRTRLTIDYRREGESDWRAAAATLPAASAAGPTAEAASYQVFRFSPGANTTWELRVRRLPGGHSNVDDAKTATSYTAAVFAAAEQVQILASLADRGFSTGQPLPIQAELRTAGHPVRGATVKAVVRVPQRSFSSTLRRYAKQLSGAAVAAVDNNRPAVLAAEMKRLLARNGERDDLYLYREVEVSLHDIGGGIYSGELSGAETHIAGDYQVTVFASANVPSGRTVERTAELATICNVGPADPGQSRVEVVLSRPRADGTRLETVVVLPTDRFGNAAFPGSGYQIDVSAAGASPLGALVDNLDSSFTQQLALQPGATGKVRVTVRGVDLETGPAAGSEGPRREASFHLGWAIPYGSLANRLASGVSGAFDLAYRFDASLALRGELGLSRLTAHTAAGRRLDHFAIYLQNRWPADGWLPYVEAGFGAYDLQGRGRAAGFSAGLGLQYVLSRRWNLDLSLHGHHAGGNLDLSFTQLYGGAIYKF
jgi:hypothetical protein